MGTVYNKMGGSGSVSAVQDFPLDFNNIPANGQVNQVVTISGNTILSYGLISIRTRNATADQNQKRIQAVVDLEKLSNTQINVKCSGDGWGYSNAACRLTLRVWYK